MQKSFLSSKYVIGYILLSLLLISGTSCTNVCTEAEKDPVDYVNPYIGTISHLLVPTFPTVHLPNSMLRVYPERYESTENTIKGLPIIVTSHRGSSAFALSPIQGNKLQNVVPFSYDNEVMKPYGYNVFLDENEIDVNYAVSHQSAIYSLDFKKNAPTYLIVNSRDGELKVDGNTVSGFQKVDRFNTNVYLYMETDIKPENSGILVDNQMQQNKKEASGKNSCIVMQFANKSQTIHARYGISFISVEQAKKNLEREIKDYDLKALADKGRALWNNTLGKIKIEGDDENAKTVFYTSLYRTYERMISLSEDGRYYSAFDGQIHEDKGRAFYTDDWIWDTYRATHPLRALIEPKIESDMVYSFIRMAEQMDEFWMPTFPEVTGDSRRMNSNHGVATVIDAYIKGVEGFDLAKAYEACKNAITEKTLAPWSAQKAGELDKFYKEHGYFPALHPGEKETAPEVHSFESRQPVAVTLGTVYDEWCLAQIAKELGLTEDYNYFMERSKNYRTIFNSETGFFHPKDKDGKFIEPFDYRWDSGQGARDTYGENNGWVYRWDVPHNVADLIALNGGKEKFSSELERMYNTPLGKSKYDFYSKLPDHTGNVGQFSMANEPCLHIPYLYNYAGEPWKTQKRIRTLLDQWFRNDLMGIPGDEDGGGVTAFIVFSQLGFYPVTPGLPMYVIGSPVFKNAKVNIGNGKTFEINCLNYSPENKYIQKAVLNGEEWNKSWFSHADLMQGGKLEFTMGKYANKNWATSDDALPPSFEMK